MRGIKNITNWKSSISMVTNPDGIVSIFSQRLSVGVAQFSLQTTGFDIRSFGSKTSTSNHLPYFAKHRRSLSMCIPVIGAFCVYCTSFQHFLLFQLKRLKGKVFIAVLKVYQAQMQSCINTGNLFEQRVYFWKMPK